MSSKATSRRIMHVDSDESWRKQHSSAQEHVRHAKFIDGKGDADIDANLRLESARQTVRPYGYDVYSFIKDDALKAIVPNRGGIPTDLQRIYSTAEGIPGHLSA